MHDAWRDLRKRLQHETPLMQCWMRNGQSGLVDYLVAKEKDVDVDEARAFGLKTLASQGAFDLEQTLQKRLWREAVSSSTTQLRNQG